MGRQFNGGAAPRRRFPSIREVVAEASAAAVRFPAPLVVSVACGVVCSIAVHDNLVDRTRTIATLALGIPLSFALSAGVERLRLPAPFAWVATAVLLVAHYASADWQTTTAFYYRTAELVVGAHLLVAFLPYVGRGRAAGFWSWNEGLFTRAVITVVFSSVVFAGLTVALLTVRYLLEVEVKGEAFAHLFFAVAFGFNTWVFLAGVPDPLPDAPTAEVPHALAIFTQRILMPLVVLYLAILYAYVAKIALARAWPEGTVGYLVSAFAALGILALLLADPLRDSAAHPWIRTFARGFYPALVPLVVLLVLATWRRIDEYGVTERRYFLLTFGLWLGAMAAYFGVARGRDVRVVPITLCAGILATIAGPWGAYEISRRDQLDRLTRLLTERGVLADGRLVFATAPVDWRTRVQVSSILDYLVSLHDDDLPQWIELDGIRRPPSHGSPAKTMAAMGLDYVREYERGDRHRAEAHFFWRAKADATDAPLAVGDFEALVQGVSLRDGDGTRSTTWNGAEVRVTLVDRQVLRVTVADASAVAQLAPLLGALRAAGRLATIDVPVAELRLPLDGPDLKAVFVASELTGKFHGDAVEVERLEGALLFGRAPARR